MRVKDCKTCAHCVRRTYSTYYEPKNYHPIGMSHAYAYCTKHRTRVAWVKNCNFSQKSVSL